MTINTILFICTGLWGAKAVYHAFKGEQTEEIIALLWALWCMIGSGAF